MNTGEQATPSFKEWNNVLKHNSGTYNSNASPLYIDPFIIQYNVKWTEQTVK